MRLFQNKNLYVFLTVLAMGMVVVSACLADIRFYDFEELADRDMSPEAKSALFVDSEIVWHHSQTPHFIYHFTSTSEAMQPYLSDAEAYYGWVKELFGIRKDEWIKRVHLFVFEKEWAWKKFAERVHQDPKVSAFTGGWELFIRHQSENQTRIKTLSHELAHIILFRFLDGVPPLSLNEGFAEFVSYRAVFEKRGKGEDNAKIKLIRPIAVTSYIPLSSLVDAQSYPADRLEVFYIESEAMVRYLVLNYGGENFYKLLRACAQGKTFREAFRGIYEISFETLEQGFKAHVTTKSV